MVRNNHFAMEQGKIVPNSLSPIPLLPSQIPATGSLKKAL